MILTRQLAILKYAKNRRNNRLNDWVTRKTKSARDINETIGYQGKVKYSRYLYNCWLLGKPQSVRDTTVSLGETKSVLNTIVQIGPQREQKCPRY